MGAFRHDGTRKNRWLAREASRLNTRKWDPSEGTSTHPAVTTYSKGLLRVGCTLRTTPREGVPWRVGNMEGRHQGADSHRLTSADEHRHNAHCDGQKCGSRRGMYVQAWRCCGALLRKSCERHTAWRTPTPPPTHPAPMSSHRSETGRGVVGDWDGSNERTQHRQQLGSPSPKSNTWHSRAATLARGPTASCNLAWQLESTAADVHGSGGLTAGAG